MDWTASRRDMVRAVLSVILATAGAVHLLRPEIFLPAMPPYIPCHRAMILLTGVLELAAAAGLWVPYLRTLAAWCLVAYFVAILPAHVHVSRNAIPMFGIRSPALLWARTAFQAAFVAAAWSLTRQEKR
ncbi:MAG: DoxX family protein [Isosphaeraceae bacterium]